MMETQRSIVFAHAVQGIIWRAEHGWTMAAGASISFGLAIPDIEIISLNREYYTNSTGIAVSLYEANFSGGTPVHTINRRLKYRENTPPMQIFHGVTHGALTDFISGFDLETPNGIRVGKRGDLEPVIHDALKSYVLLITNTGTTEQPFGLTVDYRLMQPEEEG